MDFKAALGDDQKSVDFDIEPKVFIPFKFSYKIVGTQDEEDFGSNTSFLRIPFQFNHPVEFVPAEVSVTSMRFWGGLKNEEGTVRLGPAGAPQPVDGG